MAKAEGAEVTMGMFTKAIKHESKLRLAIMGPSGSGKTYTSLAVATALANGKPVAVLDTESGSASKYSDTFEFDVAELRAPFHPDKFIDAIHEAEKAGYGVLIIDSLSHAWSGTGGVLDVVDEAAKRSKSGNTYMAWKEGTPVHNRLIDAIVQSGIHIIVTMRSKTEYTLKTNDRGKQTPEKVGMAPVQRDGMEYEFDVVFDMDMDNNAIVSKSRCSALARQVIAKPGAQVAETLAQWLSGAPAPQVDRTALLEQFHNLGDELYAEQWEQVSRRNVQRITNHVTDNSHELTTDQLQQLIVGMTKLKTNRQPAPIAA